ncbi:MBL fold metallo-hydrolase [Marinoscillum furvescens]|uniref:Ribonuclease BN (tRNA processing enzyme) n=1 Tax=Marinoscillum furvescens DSM 4134 TaxID=1122208 RepID=A0A3D9KY58_MARFU|nr:MBL fold metallo-hydrolase [Marinoscillum furvescens]RED93902.1 ribonuclease BN (tRNA processing enzyme) [Marinoscillum furvescens DSM 4134]
MKMTVLGCGDAFASAGRFNTSFLLEEELHKVLIDCGASTLIRLKQLNIAVDSIDTIIITHFHGDHYGGLPFLMLSNHLECKRKHPLTIIGPEGIRDRLYALQEAMYPGTQPFLTALDLRFLEFQENNWIQAAGVDVYARKVTHAPPSNPHGVKVRIGEQVFGFSGDTEWDDALIDLADETDAFVIECNNFDIDTPGHLSYQTILNKKDFFKTQKLLLTHMGNDVINQKHTDIQRLEDGAEVTF